MNSTHEGATGPFEPVITMNLRNREGKKQAKASSHKLFFTTLTVVIVVIFVSLISFALSKEDARLSEIDKKNAAAAKFQEEAPEVVYK